MIKKYFTPVSKTELVLRVIIYIIAGLIVANFMALLGFLYQRFYLTLTQAEEVVILKSQLSLSSLDVDLYLNIKNSRSWRSDSGVEQGAILKTGIKNPFAK